MPDLDDCYRLLGLEPDADEDEIRRAYKALVLKYHPDRGEGSDAERFREIQEAYEILTDAEKQKECLREARREAKTGRRKPRQTAQKRSSDGLEMGSFDDLFKDLFGWREPRLNPRPAGTLEVILTPEEARRGMRIPLEVPITFPCRECGGSGGYLVFICPGCAGWGVQQHSKTVTLNVPPNTVDNQAGEMILDDARMLEGRLRVIVRVGHEA